MEYNRIIEKEAIDFILEQEDMFKKAIVDETESTYDIDDFDRTFHENITDRAYTLSDAAFVIENSDNPESDSGMWEGQEPEEALKTQAAYTFSNDVNTEITDQYNKITQWYTDTCDESDLENDIEEKIKSDIINQIFIDFKDEQTTESIETGTEEELHLLKRWMKRSDEAGMRGGYPLGSSYIDSRCGVGYGQMDQYDYIEFDHMVAKMLPDMAHKYRGTIEPRIKELEQLLHPHQPINEPQMDQ
jgi:hypothetical protein